MRVRRFEDPRSFLEAAAPLLSEDEPRHNLLYGIVDALIRRPETYLSFHLWVAGDDDPAAVAIQTPPYNLVLARPRSPAALDALAGAVASDADAVPGVSGALPEAEEFARAWATRTGAAWSRRMSMGVYACRSALDVPTAAGTSRLAGPEDFDALHPLLVAFAEEALTEPGRELARSVATMRARLDDDPAVSGFWVREVEGRIVALSGHGGRTPTGIRIGPVYTPPGNRRRGYATALVHEQTAWLLGTVASCFLYTDLANPTSNAIYRRIGYEQICDAVEIAFEAG